MLAGQQIGGEPRKKKRLREGCSSAEEQWLLLLGEAAVSAQ